MREDMTGGQVKLIRTWDSMKNFSTQRFVAQKWTVFPKLYGPIKLEGLFEMHVNPKF